MSLPLPRDILDQVRRVEIRTHRLVNDMLAGRYHSAFKGRGMDFDEVREYTSGDEIRNIDWKVSARTGKLFVKQYREERELTILLLIDISASGLFGSAERSKREYMAELGSVLAFSAVGNNDKVGLVLFTDTIELFIPPAKGRRHILRVIREILFFQPQRDRTDLVQALDFTNQVIRRQAVVFLISDFCLPGAFDDALATLEPKLKLTHRRHDLIAVSVTDPRESQLPNVGRIIVEDAETGEQVLINTGRASVRNRFADMARARQQALGRAIRRAGIDFLPLHADRSYLKALMQFFSLRERRRR
jgi:uncharacterized protein (DUF58 family)